MSSPAEASAAVDEEVPELETPPGSPSADTLPSWAAQALQDWDVEELAEHIVAADVPAAFPDRIGEHDFADFLRQSARENLRTLREFLSGRIGLVDVELDRPVEFASAQAQLGIPQSALQHSYRVGFLTIWRHWTALLHARAEAADADPADLVAVLERTTGQIFSYQDRALGLVSAGYTRREEALRRTGEQVRQQVVRELLAGDTRMHTEDLFLALGYDLSAVHLVVLVPGVSDAHAKRLAAQLRTAGGAATSLAVRTTARDTVIWLGRPRTWPTEQVRAVRDALERTGRTAALSQPGRGLAGFRSGHAETLQVEEVRRVWREAPAVLDQGEVQLEALLIADLPAARRFVAQELGQLADDSELAERLRETLLVSFSATSHIATAERLNLHEHTVRNRLQRAEQLLGRPLTERRVELQVALRIRRLLGSAPDPDR